MTGYFVNRSHAARHWNVASVACRGPFLAYRLGGERKGALVVCVLEGE
jgi:hypothetical protein